MERLSPQCSNEGPARICRTLVFFISIDSKRARRGNQVANIACWRKRLSALLPAATPVRAWRDIGKRATSAHLGRRDRREIRHRCRWLAATGSFDVVFRSLDFGGAKDSIWVLPPGRKLRLSSFVAQNG